MIINQNQLKVLSSLQQGYHCILFLAWDVDKIIRDEESRRRNWLADVVNTYCRAQGIETANYLKPVGFVSPVTLEE